MALAAQASINAADTAWMMTSTALVLLMTLPGIALFYAGMVRRKNVLATMAAVVAIAAAVSLTWFAVGYSLAFTAGWPWLGGLSRWGFSGFEYLKEAGQVAVSHVAPNVPESVYAMFQLTFAIITTALVLGAFVERMRFSAVLWFALLWSVLVYAPVAHWVWEPAAGSRRWARSTSRAARWCTSTRASRGWCAPTRWGRARAMAAKPSSPTAWQ
jgi:Amt family ammonium transporter